MTQESYFENIHNYLNGNMKDAEKTAFEQTMEASEALRRDVLFEKKLLKGMELAGGEEVRQTIGEVHRKLQGEGFFTKRENPPTRFLIIKNPIMKRTLAIAASAALLLFAAWWVFLRKPAVDANAAFAQYFKPETSRVGEIIKSLESFGAAGAMTSEDSLREALKLYDDGKYGEATAALDAFLAHNQENDTAKFYLALSHLNESRYARAVEILVPLSQSEDFPLRNDVKWYLGLCYLKVENRLEKAVDIFKDLSADSGYKDRQAAAGMLRLLGQ